MIAADDEFVKIDSIVLPGVFKSIEVKGSAVLEELEVEGKGKKPKQATGFNDHTIDIDIVLQDDIDGVSKEDKLTIIQNIFKANGQSIPKIYSIVNRHTAVRNINRVILKDLTSKETNKKDEINVSLSFVEYEPVNVSAASNKSSTNKSNTKKSANSKKNSSGGSSGVSKEYKSYLSNNRGTAPKLKTSSSPANSI